MLVWILPVVALGFAVAFGRVGTIVMDAMRVDFSTDMDGGHEFEAKVAKNTA